MEVIREEWKPGMEKKEVEKNEDQESCKQEEHGLQVLLVVLGVWSGSCREDKAWRAGK